MPVLFLALKGMILIKYAFLTLLIMDVAFIFSLCIDWRPRFNVIQIDVIRSYALCWDSLRGGKVLIEIHFLLDWLIHCCLITVEGLLPRL